MESILVLTHADESGAVLSKGSLESVTAGRELAARLGAELTIGIVAKHAASAAAQVAGAAKNQPIVRAALAKLREIRGTAALPRGIGGTLTDMNEEKEASSRLSEKWQQALEHHRRGRLAPAKAAYKQILAIQPRHIEALHLLGVIALQTGNAQGAVQLIEKAIASDSSMPMLALIGIGLMYGPIKPETKAIGSSAAITVSVAKMVGPPTSSTACGMIAVKDLPGDNCNAASCSGADFRCGFVGTGAASAASTVHCCGAFWEQ